MLWILAAAIFSSLLAGEALANTQKNSTKHEKSAENKNRTVYSIESQSNCQVFLLTRQKTPASVGDVIHFVDLLGQTSAKGRVLARNQSTRSGFDRLELSLAKHQDKPCPKLKETVASLGDAEVRGEPVLPSLPSTIEFNLLGGYISENWKVSEKSSGSGFSAGLLASYEFQRSKTFGFMLHGLITQEILSLKNQSQGIVGVDEETDISRFLAGTGIGVTSHFGRNGHSRVQILALYDMSLAGSINFNISGSPTKRDYGVTSRIRPGLRYDQTLFSSVLLGIGASYSLLNMTVQDMEKSEVKITGDAIHADLSLGMTF